jgi:hypothetical protein
MAICRRIEKAATLEETHDSGFDVGEDGYQAYACKDGSGTAIFAFGTGNVWEYFNAKGALIGSNHETDVVPDDCPIEYWGIQLACDMTPVDLACPVTQ